MWNQNRVEKMQTALWKIHFRLEQWFVNATEAIPEMPKLNVDYVSIVLMKLVFFPFE